MTSLTANPTHRRAANPNLHSCSPRCPLPLGSPPAGGYHPVVAGELFKEGRYRALHPLGQGHYSTVWMAHDAFTGQQVAIKVSEQGREKEEGERRGSGLVSVWWGPHQLAPGCAG